MRFFCNNSSKTAKKLKGQNGVFSELRGIMEEIGQKKAEYSKIALHPRPDQEPAKPMQTEYPARSCKNQDTISLDTINLWIWQRTFFTWSVSDVFAVKYEQF